MGLLPLSKCDEKIRRVIAYGLSQDRKCEIRVKKKRLDAACEAVGCGHKCSDQSHELAPFWVSFWFGFISSSSTIIDVRCSHCQAILDSQMTQS
jgi:hypothetical protein